MALPLQINLYLWNRIENQVRRRALRNERHITRVHSSVLELDDIELKKLFRVTRSLFSLILHELSPHLKIGTTRRALTPQIKVSSFSPSCYNYVCELELQKSTLKIVTIYFSVTRDP